MALDTLRPATSNPVRTMTRTGGVATNVARVLARLGESVVVCSAVGDDPAGTSLIDHLRAEGIDTAGVARLPDAATARYTAVVGPDGSLFVGLADAAVYDALGDEWAVAAVRAAQSCDIWMLDTNLPAGVLAAIIAAAGDRTVAADPVSVPKAGRLDGVLGSLSVVFPDGAELQALTGSSDPSAGATALHARGPTVVASLGADGLVVAGGDGVERRPALPVERVADETGAGDALVGGYLHGVIAGDDDPVLWGLAAAALAVSQEGSVPPGITRSAVGEMVAATR
jgi:pseudouridine kinase